MLHRVVIFPERRSSLARAALLVLLAAPMMVGCGRKATHEDCEVVVDKNVELQLKALGVTDPAIVTKRRDEMRAAMHDDIDKCVGKRVTDGMMKCVKAAETADKIDKCLR
jgi:protein required for attachment to host cells